MITFHHNFFPDVCFTDHLKKDTVNGIRLSNAFIQILFTKAIINYLGGNSFTVKCSLNLIVSAIKIYLRDHLSDCCKKIILYRDYTTEMVDIMNDNVTGGMIAVPKGLYDMWYERRANRAQLDGKIIDENKDLTIEELIDRKSFCLYGNQDVYDNCFVYIDIQYLLKLIKID